jgi:transposase
MDRVAVVKLLDLLVRCGRSEPGVWRVLDVPALGAEDCRDLRRELEELKAERTQHISRIRGILVGLGVPLD